MNSKQMNRIAQVRRYILKSLVEKDGLTTFAGRVGKPASQINDMIAGRKSFGTTVARELEIKAGLPKYFFEGEAEIPANSYSVDPKKINAIPVVGKSMGGLPDRIFTDEGRPINGHDEAADIYSSDSSAFITRVDGDSMSPKYDPGGYALIEPNTDIDVGDDVLIKTASSGVMLKRLISRKGGVTLASYNESAEFTFPQSQIIWMYYVAYPVPAKKINRRM